MNKNFWNGFEKRAEEYSDEEITKMLAGLAKGPKNKHILLKGLAGAGLGGLTGGGLTGMSEGAVAGAVIGGVLGISGRHDNKRRELARDILTMSDGPEKTKRIRDASPKRFWSPFTERDMLKGRRQEAFGD